MRRIALLSASPDNTAHKARSECSFPHECSVMPCHGESPTLKRKCMHSPKTMERGTSRALLQDVQDRSWNVEHPRPSCRICRTAHGNMRPSYHGTRNNQSPPAGCTGPLMEHGTSTALLQSLQNRSWNTEHPEPSCRMCRTAHGTRNIHGPPAGYAGPLMETCGRFHPAVSLS